MTRPLLCVLAVMLLAGCVERHRAVGAGVHPVAADKTIRLQPASGWNRLAQAGAHRSRGEVWTREGRYLDWLGIWGGLKPGQTLFANPASDRGYYPRIRYPMLPHEVADMIESSLRLRQGAHIFHLTALGPRPFLGLDGFQIDFRFIGSDEVARQGRAVGAFAGGRLFMMLFHAPSLYYFDAQIGRVDGLITGARANGPAFDRAVHAGQQALRRRAQRSRR
ncbi:MAG: hypothetical protein ACFB22_05285 [Rhodothalassiaceae bacterium]